MSDLAMNWHLGMPLYSSCKLCRNDSLKVVGMMILESFRSKLLSDVSSLLISQYLWIILGACVCEAGHPLCVSL